MTPRARYGDPLNFYLRAVRGGKRPADAFKFRSERGWGEGRRTRYVSITRRVDGLGLGYAVSEPGSRGRWLAFAAGRSAPTGSYATQRDAAIALEGVAALAAHRKGVKEYAERRTEREARKDDRMRRAGLR